MPIGKRATAPIKKPAAAPAEEAASDNVITSYSLSRAYTVNMGIDTGSVKVSAHVTGTDYDTVTTELDRVLELELEKASAGFAELTGGERSVGGEASEEAEEGAAEGDDEAEEGAIGPDEVNAMKRPELVALIEEHEIEIDADDYPKNAKGLTALRAAIIEAAFGEDDGEASEEGEEGDEDATGDAEEGDIDEDTINAMERPALVALIKDNELDIDVKKYPKLSALRAAVIEYLAENSDSGDEESEESDDSDGYTEEQLSELKLDDLKAIWGDWEIPGKFPAGPPVKVKKAAIAKILEFQSEAE